MRCYSQKFWLIVMHAIHICLYPGIFAFVDTEQINSIFHFTAPVHDQASGYAEILFTMAKVRREAESDGNWDDLVVLEGPLGGYDRSSLHVELWFDGATGTSLRTASIQVRRSHLRKLLVAHIGQQIKDQLQCIRQDVANYPEKQRPFISLLFDLRSLVDKGLKKLTMAVDEIDAKDTHAQTQSMIRIGSMVQGIIISEMIHQVMEHIEHIDYSNGNQRKIIIFLDELRRLTDDQWIFRLEQRQLEAATAQPSAARPGLRL